MLSTGQGTLGSPIQVDYPYSANQVAVSDFNNDGIPDLAVVSIYAGIPAGPAILLGKGDGTFGPLHFLGATMNGYTIAAGDFNHDGNQDIAVVDSCCSLLIFLGNGKGAFKALTSQTALGLPQQLIAVDLNGDGYPDLVGNAFGIVQIYLNEGTGVFHAESPQFTVSGISFTYLQPGDINNDGKIDLVSFSDSYGTLSMLLNTTK
jgi:hypothetical protein